MLKTFCVLAILIICNIGFAEPSNEFVRYNELQIVSADLGKVASALSAFKVITIGEMHGSREAPQFVGQLFKSFEHIGKSVVLGVEVPIGDQATIDRFVRTKDRNVLKHSSFFTRNLRDGRSSKAMVQLLESLPKKAKVICFDSPNAGSGQQRDKEMAENLLRAAKEGTATLLVLAGNIHSAIEIGSPFDPTYKPMGYFLHSLAGSNFKLSEISALKLRYSGGSIWACMGASESDCKVHQLNPLTSVYGTAVTHKSYFLPEPLAEGYNGTLFIRELNASQPAFR
jgi:hypothetical protein